MNIKYKTDSDGNLVVINENGELIVREDKYTKNTDLILSLENIIKLLEKKSNYFRERQDEIKTEYKNNQKNIIIYTIVSFLSISFLILIYSIFSITILNILMSIFLCSYISTLIPDILILLKNNKELKEYTKKINIENHKIKKINKRIDMLSNNANAIKKQTDNHINIDKVNDYIEVKNIPNYYDASDYFIMNYTINKYNKTKEKTRKLTKEDNRIYKM